MNELTFSLITAIFAFLCWRCKRYGERVGYARGYADAMCDVEDVEAVIADHLPPC